MPYESQGTLTTDVREVSVSSTWDTQSDWEAYQSASNIAINNGAVELSETLFEGFEDGDIAEYSGDTGAFTVQQSTVYDGTYALEASNGSGEHAITRTDWTVGQGDSITSYYQAPDSTVNKLLFGVQSATGVSNVSGYAAVVYQRGASEADNALMVQRYDNGSSTTLSETNQDVPADTWMELEVVWGTTGTITATLYQTDGTQIMSTSASDTTYTSGGIGFIEGIDPGYYDNVRIQ